MLYKIGDHIQDKYVLINISITESKRGIDIRHGSYNITIKKII